MSERPSDRRLVPSIFGLAGHAVSVAGLRPGLAALGLHVVTAEDKAVLDAMASIPDESIHWRGASPGPMWEPARVAERAKRGLPSPEPAEPRECGGVGKCRVCNGQQILRDSAAARARREAGK